MGTIELTFDLPDSPLSKQSGSVLLLALETPPRGENLAVTFSSQSLQPEVQVTTQLKFFNLTTRCLLLTSPDWLLFPSQSVCISGETSYVLLTGRQHVSGSWRISAAATSLQKSTTTAGENAQIRVRKDASHFLFLAEQILRDVLIGGKPGSGIAGAALLLPSGGRTADGRSPARNSNFPTQLSASSKPLLSFRSPGLLEVPALFLLRPPRSSAS